MIIRDIDAFIASSKFPPQRIISLVPSITEFLVDLELGRHVVGVTKFCVRPDGFKSVKTIIGGTKNVHIDRIRDLQPDLIIANKEENERDQVEALALEFDVLLTDVPSVAAAYDMMRMVGRICGATKAVQQMLLDLQEYEARLQAAVSISSPKKVLYLIWRDPWMAVGSDTFIGEMLARCGWENVLADRLRYPSLSDTEIQALQPELVLLSSEPYPFKDKHCAELQALLPHSNIQLVDGEAFSWYGSHMYDGFDYLRFLVLKFA